MGGMFAARDWPKIFVAPVMPLHAAASFRWHDEERPARRRGWQDIATAGRIDNDVDQYCAIRLS